MPRPLGSQDGQTRTQGIGQTSHSNLTHLTSWAASNQMTRQSLLYFKCILATYLYLPKHLTSLIGLYLVSSNPIFLTSPLVQLASISIAVFIFKSHLSDLTVGTIGIH